MTQLLYYLLGPEYEWHGLDYKMNLVQNMLLWVPRCLCGWWHHQRLPFSSSGILKIFFKQQLIRFTPIFSLFQLLGTEGRTNCVCYCLVSHCCNQFYTVAPNTLWLQSERLFPVVSLAFFYIMDFICVIWTNHDCFCLPVVDLANKAHNIIFP